MGTGPKASGSAGRRATFFALHAVILPMVLAACSGSNATDTPGSAAGTVAPSISSGVATAASGSATVIRPLPTAAASTVPAASVTISGTTVSGTAAAGGPATATTASAASSGADPRGMAPTKRGGGGTLKLLWWQAPTILSTHLAQGQKDADADRLIHEPLAVTTVDSQLPNVPVLAKSIPSLQDGSVAADGKSVTWKLKDGVKWSDSTPFTSADVKATWQFIVKPENGAATAATYENIASIDTPDTSTVYILFKAATTLWHTPFTNESGAIMQKKQIEGCAAVKECDLLKSPIGTGPYTLTSFVSGDNVQYTVNDNYREPNAPFFDAIDLKGGGDASMAAKALQDGQVDFAWNLQVAPDVIKQITDAGKVIDAGPGFGIEQIAVNLTDPNKEVDGEKSSLQVPHPFLSDPKVREAISYLIDRDTIARTFYAVAKPTCNVLLGIPPTLQSKTTCGFDVAKANQLLDDAGWKKGSDGIRARNGVQMKIVFGSTNVAVREKEEQIIKQAFQQAGIAMDIKNADAGVFFGQPDNADAASRFEKDMEMFTNGPSDPDAQQYLAGWTTKEITQKANGWKGNNYSRWSNPEYDKLYDQLTKELNPEKRAAIEVQLNDLIANNFIHIPMVDRYSSNGHAKELINTNYTPWDSALWNVAYWQIKK